MIEALILAGGLGTRLAQTVPHLPKALAPIQGTPFLDLLLKQLAQSGCISKVIFALGHKATAIQQHLQNNPYGLSIEFSIEPSPLGTGGAILQALHLSTTNQILVMNGDSYCDLSIPSLIRFHNSLCAEITLVACEVNDASRYGTLDIDCSCRILAFHEKCSPLTEKRGQVNAGIYLIEKKILANRPICSCSLEKELFPALLNHRFFAYRCPGGFIDIGTADSYHQAQDVLKPWIP